MQLSSTSVVQSVSSLLDQGRYSQAYSMIVNDLASQHLTLSADDRNVLNWLNTALEVNSDDDSLAALAVRVHNVDAVEYETGKEIGLFDQLQQKASNAEAQNFVGFVIANGGQLPGFDYIVNVCEPVGLGFLGISNAGWGGALPSGYNSLAGFTNSSYYNNLTQAQQKEADILHVNDLSMLAAYASAKGIGLSDAETDALLDNIAFYGNYLAHNDSTYQGIGNAIYDGTSGILAGGTKAIAAYQVTSAAISFALKTFSTTSLSALQSAFGNFFGASSGDNASISIGGGVSFSLYPNGNATVFDNANGLSGEFTLAASDGTHISANVSGQGAIVDLSNASITLAPRAMAEIDGVGNQITGGVDGVATVNNVDAGTSYTDAFSPTASVTQQFRNFSGLSGMGKLLSQQTNLADGTLDDTSYDPASGNVSQDYKISSTGQADLTVFDALTTTQIFKASFVKGQLTEQSQSNSIDIKQFSQATASALASQIISQFLFKNNLPASAAGQAFSDTAISTILGTSDPATQQAFAKLTAGEQFVAGYAISVSSIAASMAGSAAGSALFKALGLPAPVGSVVGGALSQQAVDSIINDISTGANGVGGTTLGIAEGATGALDLASVEDAVARAGAGAIGDYIGDELSSLVIGTPTEGSSFGGAVGGALGTFFGAAVVKTIASDIGATIASEVPLVGTLIGAAVGSFLGSLFGGLFGGGTSVGPNANAPIIYDPVANSFWMATNHYDNGGNTAISSAMGTATINILNGVLHAIGGHILNPNIDVSIVVGYFAQYGYDEFEPLAGETDRQNMFNNVDVAIDTAAFRVLRSIVVTGGNPYMEYALSHGSATTLDGLMSNLNSAYDYGNYRTNPALFNLNLSIMDNQSNLDNWFAEEDQAQAMGLALLPSPGSFVGSVLTDTAADISDEFTVLQSLAVTGLVTSITLTDGGVPNLTLTVAQVTQDLAALNIIVSPHHIMVVDNTTTVSQNAGALDALAASGAISITLNNPGAQISFSASAVMNVTHLLSAIQSPYVLNVVNDGTMDFLGSYQQGLLGNNGNDYLYQLPGNIFYVAEDSNGQEVGGKILTYGNGTPVLINPASTTVVATANDFLSQDGNDIITVQPGNKINISEYNDDGVYIGGRWLTFPDGTPVLMNTATTKIIWIGDNFFGQGGKDIFTVQSGNTINVSEYNAAGVYVAGRFLTYPDGTSVLINSAVTKIIWIGDNFLGQGGKDIFTVQSGNTINVSEYNTAGVYVAGRFLTYADGTPVLMNTAATEIIWIGDNFLGQGGKDIFTVQSGNTINVSEYNASGVYVTGQWLSYADGMSFLIDPATTAIIWTGNNFLGQGGRDIFTRQNGNTINISEFNASGVYVTGQWLSYADGTSFLIDTATTAIIWTGNDFLGRGGRDIFTRQPGNKINISEFNANGVYVAGQSLTNADGNSLLFDTSTEAFLGTGQNFLGTGGRDVFLRESAGVVSVRELNAAGQVVASQYLQAEDGSPFRVDTSATSLLGSAQNVLGHGGQDLILLGQPGNSNILVVYELDKSGRLIDSHPLTVTNGLRVSTAGVAVADTAANISVVFGALQALALSGQLASITVTDQNLITLMTGQLADVDALAKISGNVAVVDTAANVQAALASLTTSAARIVTIIATGGTLNVSVATFTASRAALDKIAGHFGVTDTAANIASQQAALASDNRISSLTTTSGGAIVAQSTFNPDGSLLLHYTVTKSSNVALDYHFAGGSFFAGKGFAAFDNVTNVSGVLLSQTLRDATGKPIQLTTFNANGTIYEQNTVTYAANGTIDYHFAGGSFFAGKKLASFDNITNASGLLLSQELYDSSGTLTQQTYFNADGSIYEQATDTKLANGNLDHHYAVGSYFVGKPFVAFDNITSAATGSWLSQTYYDASGKITSQTTYNADGSLHLGDTVTRMANGTIDYHFQNGSFFTDKSFAAFDNVTNASGVLLTQTLLDATGAPVQLMTFNANGSVYEQAAITRPATGEVLYRYTTGSFFTGKPYSAFDNLATTGGTLLDQILYNKDGSHTFTVPGSGLTLTATHNDSFTVTGKNETVRFGADGFGADTFKGYAAGDAFSFAPSVFANYAALSQHVTGTTSAVVTDTANDTLTLTGVATSSLNAGMFKFA